MTAGRNKNSRAGFRQDQRHKALLEKREREFGLKKKRKAKKLKSKMYRLKNSIEHCRHDEAVKRAAKVRKMKSKIWDLVGAV